MITGLQHLHSYLAYLVLALLLVTVLIALMNVMGNKPFAGLAKWSKLTMIATHTQILIGIVLYIMEHRYADMGEQMKISAQRLLALEHPLMMLLGVVLITIGNSKAKKADADTQKNKRILIYFGLGLVLILSRIPYSQWF